MSNNNYQLGDLSKLFGSSTTTEESESKALWVTKAQAKTDDNDELITKLKKEKESSDDKPKRQRKEKREKKKENKKDKKQVNNKRKAKEESDGESDDEDKQEAKKSKYEAKDGELDEKDDDDKNDEETNDKNNDEDIFKSVPKRKKQNRSEKRTNNEEKKKEEEKTIFISNFPIPLEDKNLKKSKKLVTKLFSVYGEIESIRFRSLGFEKSKIPTRKGHLAAGLRTKDYGTVYVHFSEMTAEMSKIISDLNGKVLHGRHLNVDTASHKETSKDENDSSIFIQNLPFEIDDEEVWETIGSEHEIVRVRIVRDPISGKCKGFGYVQLKDKETVEEILKSIKSRKAHVIQGRKIEILRCKQSTPKTPKTPKAPKASSK